MRKKFHSKYKNKVIRLMGYYVEQTKFIITGEVIFVRFLNSNWISLVMSFTIAFVMSMNQNPLVFTDKNILYFGIELIILMTASFIAIKLVNFAFSLFFTSV